MKQIILICVKNIQGKSKIIYYYFESKRRRYERNGEEEGDYVLCRDKVYFRTITEMEYVL
jgi:hypothetical protein